jgi:predicted dehydrogenase
VIGFGVIGANSMVATRAVMPALTVSRHAELVSACSMSGPIMEPWRSTSVATYADVVADPAVDAVYIALPNGMHRAWTERAVAAGKHVLCEKPLAPTADDARAMGRAAERAGVVLAEAWMTPFAPRFAFVLDAVRSGRIGEPDRIDARFTFTIDAAHGTNYRWDPNQGGGALLDVGIYLLGAAVELWGPEPAAVDATMVERGTAAGRVDATTVMSLVWPGGQRLEATASFEAPEAQTLRIEGTTGSIELRDEAHTMASRAEDVWIESGGSSTCVRVPGSDPYLGMVDAMAAAVAGDGAFPRPVRASVELATLLDRIAARARRS